MKYPSYLDMVQTLLPVEEFLEFTKRYDQPVTKSIKILQQHAHHPHSIEGFDRTGILKRLTSDGRTCTPPRFSWEGRIYDDLLFVTKADNQSLGSHPLHQAGAFYVQEMAAGLPAQVLNVQPNHLVLDMCAAPGGKSVQLADFLASPLVKEDEGKVHNNGLLISNEPNPTRRKALEANLERCGIWNAVITGYDGQTIGNILKEQCDKVLLDAPCSGEGMQYKSDVNVYHWNEKAIRKLTQTQKSLLLSGLQALKI
ncbi:MAG: RsmB/NOP family class I SAM-dependent RNA methyltransferase [Candidatus Peribacteria bacterium]|jgi:16S rRNA C967 or C1407 C5-methylase (RsmB/RsmF family)|nr:RsmB/NOP family class I SAM-dependent RNA methyltransferase [Candidatus Peribacteria bacterium]